MKCGFMAMKCNVPAGFFQSERRTSGKSNRSSCAASAWLSGPSTHQSCLQAGKSALRSSAAPPVQFDSADSPHIMTSMMICGQLPPVASKQSLANRQVPLALAQVAARRSVSAKAGEQQGSLTGEWSANWSLASCERPPTFRPTSSDLVADWVGMIQLQRRLAYDPHELHTVMSIRVCMLCMAPNGKF